LLLFPIGEMKELAGGKGVILIDLNPGERLLAARPVADALTLYGTGRGDREMEVPVSGPDRDVYIGRRARKGKPVAARFKRLMGLR
jgi:topoisomerase-4 subunit A